MRLEDIENWLKERAVLVSRIDADASEAALQHWNQAFASQVKRETGSWIHEKFRWHAFSYGFHQADEGDAAVQKYLEQWNADFLVFDETGAWCLSCAAEQYPDLSPLRHDFYVAHHNMKWTMAFTHEQPEIGPFFAIQCQSHL